MITYELYFLNIAIHNKNITDRKYIFNKSTKKSRRDLQLTRIIFLVNALMYS